MTITQFKTMYAELINDIKISEGLRNKDLAYIGEVSDRVVGDILKQQFSNVTADKIYKTYCNIIDNKSKLQAKK